MKEQTQSNKAMGAAARECECVCVCTVNLSQYRQVCLFSCLYIRSRLSLGASGLTSVARLLCLMTISLGSSSAASTDAVLSTSDVICYPFHFSLSFSYSQLQPVISAALLWSVWVFLSLCRNCSTSQHCKDLQSTSLTDIHTTCLCICWERQCGKKWVNVKFHVVNFVSSYQNVFNILIVTSPCSFFSFLFFFFFPCWV